MLCPINNMIKYATIKKQFTRHPCSVFMLYPALHLAQLFGPDPVQWPSHAYKSKSDSFNKDSKNIQDIISFTRLQYYWNNNGIN